MLEFVSKASSNELLLTEVSGLMHHLEVCLQKLHLLSEVCIFLVVLSVLVDVSEETPVVEVIDCILEDGIGGLVTPKLVMEPGGEGLYQLVSRVV